MNQGESYKIDFTIPQGPTGPAGTNIARSAYLVTFNEGTAPTGVTINSNTSLPINRKELDISGLITLDSINKTIKFNIEGYYKVTFTVSAYIQNASNSNFNKETDFVSLGFKKVNTDDVYIGTSQWVSDDIAIELVGQGIIAVNNINDLYELINLSKSQIYLDSPDRKNTISNSYFASPYITIVIEYLGRQGA